MSALVIAIPSKGRLQENANAFFARAGMPVRQSGGARGYTGSIAGLDGVEIAFLSASDIVRSLASGDVHLGVTGEDLIRETLPDADGDVIAVTPLGFGHANVVVAVPQSWIDVSTMSDLDDVSSGFYAMRRRRMRVATKYVNLTRSFFDRHGITDYRIVESLGATEGAPSAGAAELIVDITTTGATLTANALKVLHDGIILKSEATLFASTRADWNGGARGALGEVLARVHAEARAKTMREVTFEASATRRLLEEAQERFSCTAPFKLSGSTSVLHCPEDQLYALAAYLRGEGVTHVCVRLLDKVFEVDNPLYGVVANRLGW